MMQQKKIYIHAYILYIFFPSIIYIFSETSVLKTVKTPYLGNRIQFKQAECKCGKGLGR